MNLTFIETALFSRFRAEHISDDVYRALQNELLENPEKGDIVKGLNGVRKIRIPDTQRNKGKRGGIRTMYFYYTTRSHIYFLFAYGKNETEDLTTEQRKAVNALLELIKTK
ncbi:TPA: type II toxin-antitoxin system RelE/ParE family toxin [Mannheimia haemolytica]|uniref:type II toxin-antitoxin system RelE/ParE family toxin n=1 Tax=Mannheimia sp. E30BD TaxID=3278708 RepID=UPI0028554E64|nr:type II toxin-antitoxin system RelE/ParE family toxin [Mannheimia haemolytica]